MRACVCVCATLSQTTRCSLCLGILTFIFHSHFDCGDNTAENFTARPADVAATADVAVAAAAAAEQIKTDSAQKVLHKTQSCSPNHKHSCQCVCMCVNGCICICACVCVCGYATVGFPDFCLTFGFGHDMIYAYFLSVKSIEKSVTGKICKHMWGSSGSCVCVYVCV